ncbi:hypothetical protein NQ315_007656 [Exocentrus adspersus]|uniref:Uncharacterized protein n=1 Tax=Exocentrus adspersus TaxID=1586481 RepID=A0AAV8W831_9CUCU|nr:hypothetical protein NQ315_007656 [Exocentrus adspersus]
MAIGVERAPAPRNVADVEIVPLERHNPFGDQPIVDTGVIGDYGPFSNPFGGFLESLGGIMARMREQMEALLRNIPVVRGNSTEEIPDFPIGVDLPSFGDIDLGKGNTTSVTKIIDGHKVVINETEYKKEDDFGGAFFKVRIIDVRPESGEATTNSNAEAITSPPAVNRDTESIESSVENEIPRSREVRTNTTPEKLQAALHFDNIESFDEVDDSPYQKFKYSTDLEAGKVEIDDIKPFEDNSITSEEYHPMPIDLSGDIRVNQIMAQSGAPLNPDAEFIYEIGEPQNVRQTNFLRIG